MKRVTLYHFASVKAVSFASFLIFSCLWSDAQIEIKMKKDGGVYTIPCKVNGLDLKFIFDTGCSDVTISYTEAIFMLKNGYLNKSDIGESAFYTVATGNVVEGTTITLKTLEIGGREIHNVKASIVHTSSAPLLLGGSALEKFDGFSIDYANEILVLGKDEKMKKSTLSTILLLLIGLF